jgi:multicomponent Na+:H+ antiporter subunit G
MNDLIAAMLLIIGGLAMLLAGVGVLRMPDLFMRMQSATKAATLGAGCSLLAVAFHFGELGVTTRALLIIAFLFLTAPVAAHVIARAAYATGVKLWDSSVYDQLSDDRRASSEDTGSALKQA